MRFARQSVKNFNAEVTKFYAKRTKRGRRNLIAFDLTVSEHRLG